MDPKINTLPYLYTLLAHIGGPQGGKQASPATSKLFAPGGALWLKMLEFMDQFDPIQVRYAGQSWRRLVETVAKVARATSDVSLHCHQICPTQRSVPLTLRSRWWPSSLLGLPCFVSTQRPHASRQHIRSLFVSVLVHVHTASLAQYLIMTYTISLGVWARTLRMRLCCVRSMTRAHPTSTLPLDCRTH